MARTVARLSVTKAKLAKKRTKRFLSSQCSPKREEQTREQQSIKTRRGASHRGKKLNTWSEANMLEAIKEFMQQTDKEPAERRGVREVAQALNLPYATFRKRILLTYKSTSVQHSHMSGRPTVLSPDEENELARHVRSLAEVGFPCDRTDIRKLAFEYATKKGIRGFTLAKKTAGYYWFKGFMQRHPQLAMKKGISSLYSIKLGTMELQQRTAREVSVALVCFLSTEMQFLPVHLLPVTHLNASYRQFHFSSSSKCSRSNNNR